MAWVHEIDKLANIRKWGPTPFVHPEYAFINSCARFDYQREHVYVRTGKRSRKPPHEANLRPPQQEAAGEQEVS